MRRPTRTFVRRQRLSPQHLRQPLPCSGAGSARVSASLDHELETHDTASLIAMEALRRFRVQAARAALR